MNELRTKSLIDKANEAYKQRSWHRQFNLSKNCGIVKLFKNDPTS